MTENENAFDAIPIFKKKQSTIGCEGSPTIGSEAGKGFSTKYRIPPGRKLPSGKYQAEIKGVNFINIQNSPGAHIGNTTIYNVVINKSSAKQTTEQKTPMENFRKATTEDIENMRSLISDSQWNVFGAKLGYSPNFLMDLRENNNLPDAVQKLLTDWTQVNGRISTVGRLFNAYSEAQKLHPV